MKEPVVVEAVSHLCNLLCGSVDSVFNRSLICIKDTVRSWFRNAEGRLDLQLVGIAGGYMKSMRMSYTKKVNARGTAILLNF